MILNTALNYLQMILSKDIFYARVSRDKIEVRNVKTNEEISLNVTQQFSNSRMLVADFEVFEQQLRRAIKDVQKQGLLTRSSKIIFHPTEEPKVDYSAVEKRTFRDSCQHAGASEYYFYDGRTTLTNREIMDGIKTQFER